MSGKVDMSQLKAFRENLNDIQKAELKNMVANDLGKRFLNLIRRTDAPTYHPYVTGHLRKKWEVGASHSVGDKAVVDIHNPVEYASYVEYGHRLFVHGQDTGRMVAGRHMMTRTVQSLQGEADLIAEKIVLKYCKEKLNGQ